MSFQWKDRYNLGIDVIDKQHRKLFDIGARVYDLATLDDSYDHYDEIMKVLNELLEYTEYHFKFEEDLMKEYQFEGIGHQEEEHKFYTEKIKAISRKDIDNNQNNTITELVDFLSEWISSHILFADRSYAIDFKNRGITL